jgi:uncharacterized protein GlcG (DUF336 family)
MHPENSFRRHYWDNKSKEGITMTREQFKTKLIKRTSLIGVLLCAFILLGRPANAASDNDCSQLPSYSALKSALTAARNAANGGFNLDMWGTIVNRDGVVCAVAFTGADRGSEWPGSRVISAQKANTANSFSLPGLALSTANLYSAVQPGGSLYGLQHSNPVDTEAAYKGPSANFGMPNDPLVGSKIGGVNVFGGGLALYNSAKILVGAIGVSGDTSCADHNIAWRTRNSLKMDFVPGGVGPATRPDNINYQGLVTVPSLQADFSHPICKIAGVDGVSGISAGLPPTE